MIGYKAAYKGQIEHKINLNDVDRNGIVTLDGKFDKELRRGFYFYHDVEKLLENYYIKGMQFYKMETVGQQDLLEDDVMFATGFKNVTEISKDELTTYIRMHQDKLFSSDNPLLRKAVVAAGYRAEDALHDKAATVRVEVAKQGKFLDVLENDEEPSVLYAVVKQNHNLEKFLKHEDYDVRTEAKKRYKELNKEEK